MPNNWKYATRWEVTILSYYQFGNIPTEALQSSELELLQLIKKKDKCLM